MGDRQVKCPSCGRLLRVPENCDGCFVRCGVCQHRFQVPPLKSAEDSIADWLSEEEEGEGGQMPISFDEEDEEAEAPAPAEPQAPTLTDEQAGVRLVKWDSHGAMFEFAANRLLEPKFRCAMPRRCVTCGTRSHLRAHVIIYTGTLVDSVSLEAEHAAGALVTGEEARQLSEEELLGRLPKVPNVPAPGNLPMPYWLCDMCTGTGAIQGQIQVNRQTGVGWCRLLVRNLWRAEEFAATAGGAGCPAHVELKKVNRARAEHPWDMLAEVIRHRIEQWYKQRDGEQFLAYIPDRDYVRTEDGMSGLLISDRRMVYHTKMRHLEMDSSQSLQLELAMGGAGGHIQLKTPSWEIKRFAVDRDGLARLRRALTLGNFQATWR